MENKLDGNAAAGILHAIFPFELDLRGVRVLQIKEG